MTKYKEIFLTLLYFLAFYILSLLIGGWFEILKLFGDESWGLNYFELGYGVILLPIIYFITKKWNTKFLNTKFHKKWIIISFFLGILFTVVQPILLNILNFSVGKELIDFKLKLTDFKVFESKYALNFVSIIILIPIAEEFFFRGLIQGKLQEKYNLYLAILTQAILFGLGHLNIEKLYYDLRLDWEWAYITFLQGIILGFLFHKTKSLIPALIMHIIGNLMVVLI